MPSPRKPYEGAAKRTCLWASYGILFAKLWKCVATLPSLQFSIICFSVKLDLHIICCHLLQHKGSLLIVLQIWTLLLVALWFSYLPVTFLMPLVFLFIPLTPTKLHISIFWPLGFVAQQGSEVSLTGQAQSSPIFSLLDSKEGSFFLTRFCGGDCFLSHTVCSGCQPLWRLCDCYPENKLSFLLSTACCFLSLTPTHTLHSSPGSSVPICWQCLLEHFLLWKKSLVIRREQKK